MSGNNRKSLILKDEIAIIYVPEFLRGPVRIKRFWYVRMWDYPRALWRAIFKRKAKAPEVEKFVKEYRSEETPEPEGGAE